MISQVKQKGFTIVELLIVIVVIAILAAISIAAYTSITARANTSTAAAAAKAVKDVAQTFNTANGAYPTTKAEFVSGGGDAVAKLPADITFTTTADIGQSGTPPKTDPKAVVVQASPSSGTITGFRISYKDFTDNSTKTMDAGTVTTVRTTPLAN